MYALNGGRFSHVARGAEMIGGFWWLAGMVKAQVCVSLIQDRRWGEGATERFYNYKWLLVGER